MRVKFRVNLGSNDAAKHGLDFKLCGKNMECEVSDKAGQWLVTKGIATEVPQASQVAPTIKAIPDSPAIGKMDEPTIKSEKKPQSAVAPKKANFNQIQKDE